MRILYIAIRRVLIPNNSLPSKNLSIINIKYKQRIIEMEV